MGIQLEVSLREKTDRDGRTYLFGPIPELNLVVFVYDDSDEEEGRHTMRVKPYRPPTSRKVSGGSQAPPDDVNPWTD